MGLDDFKALLPRSEIIASSTLGSGRRGVGALLHIILFRIGVARKTLLLNCHPDLFQAEVEETLKRIQSHKGVIGTMVVNAEGKYLTVCLPDMQRPTKNLFVVQILKDRHLRF